MNVSLQQVYDCSPVLLQNLMVSTSGYQRNRSRYGHAYWSHRLWLEQFDSWPLEQKLEYQRSELVRFVTQAAAKSPFYRELYRNVDLTSFRSLKDLSDLPIVDKEMLRVNMNAVYTVHRSGNVEGHTGGTTGKSLVVLMTPHDQMRRMAQLDHFKHRLGFEHRKMRRATFNGKHIVPPGTTKQVYWRYNHACKQMIYSTFDIIEANLSAYVESLNEFKPNALDGFFTSMVDIANYIERHDLKLTFRPVGLFPTSETVTDPGRELLERVFKAKVYNQYASSEGAPFVTECSEGSLHVELSSGVFEPTDDGEVLVTSFTTHGTPLIRYQIGDSMEFTDRRDCACGVKSPIVSSISGRKDDFLYRADGGKINAGNVANLFKNMPNALVRAQALQERKDSVRILLEVDTVRYSPAYDDLLREEFAHKFGPQTTLIIEHVESIPRESSGKHRLIKNNVGPIRQAENTPLSRNGTFTAIERRESDD